jgi:6-pyruvoyltetrahydropterin/6-carboxytetrahydropterin synthase
MTEVELTRRYHFSASHRLHVDVYSDEKNREMFGKCNSPYGHGHNYTLEVTARAAVNPETGLALDQEALNQLVERAVLRDLDMKYLNEQVPVFLEATATTENLVDEIRRRLLAGWDEALGYAGASLQRIRIIETRKNEFETDC